MRVTMVKKQFADGSTCQKCVQAEELLRRRGLWERVDRVVWAMEVDPSSEGMRLAAEHNVSLAPFFLVEREGVTQVYTSVLKLVADVLAPAGASSGLADADVDALGKELSDRGPEEIVARALSLYGKDCVLAFSGAEDVALIDMAAKSGHPFRVLTLDTGRLHPETYRFLDKVRSHFGDAVFQTVVPRNVRLAEAPSHGQPILQYDIKSRGAEAYLALARELAGRKP